LRNDLKESNEVSIYIGGKRWSCAYCLGSPCYFYDLVCIFVCDGGILWLLHVKIHYSIDCMVVRFDLIEITSNLSILV